VIELVVHAHCCALEVGSAEAACGATEVHLRTVSLSIPTADSDGFAGSGGSSYVCGTKEEVAALLR
jgi:hypothetical protein